MKALELKNPFNELSIAFSSLSQGNLFLKESTSEIQKLLNTLDKETLKILYFYSLSEEPRRHENLVYAVKKLSSEGGVLELFLKDPVIERIYLIANKVRREIHRFKGFLRFKELKGGYLYAPFSSDFFILYPLAKHFAERLKHEKIILHDVKRKRGVFCYLGKIYEIVEFEEFPEETTLEKEISKLWCKYFENLAIKERENLALQRQRVPKKYRRFLTEFSQRGKE